MAYTMTMVSDNQSMTLLSKLSTVLHRRRSSASSTSSLSSSPTISTPTRTAMPTSPRRQLTPNPIFDLQDRAITALTTLYNSPASTPKYVSPSIQIEKEDFEPLTSHHAFRDVWSRKLVAMPDFQLQVAEAVADDAQRKVWVRSEVTGLPNGMRKESIDMLEFDQDGMLVAISGYRRPVKANKGTHTEE